ncbi:MAG: DUF91 domain-containing protein [Candidatus Aureabacteria bacterium]|nr:DUF91 domain-containing protein [Candidatus Auribacterota bacterium]
MPLFRLKDSKVEKVNSREFRYEAELEKLMENNLEDLTGIKLLERQYPIPNGRIDTLGIDEDNVPVVIEYKWIKDSSAIIQGLFYLNWVKQNKRTINLIVKEKFKGKLEVNWGVEPRLIIVAKSFNGKELSAINQMIPSVELKKYSFYGDLFNVEDVNVVRQKRATKEGVEPVKGRKLKEYTLDGLLNKATPQIRDLFEKLRERILAISDDVWEKVGIWYCDYRTTSTFVSPNIQKDGLKIFIKMGDKKIDDSQNLTKAVPATYGYGKLNRVFKINSADQLDYAMRLIKQAYDYVS